MAAVVWLFALSLVAADAPPPNPAGAFTHKKHAGMKLKCAFCHAGVEKEERAGFPAVTGCRACHTQLADRVIPSARVYRLPDYTIFSHSRHVAGKVECVTCHGVVYEQEQMKVERPLTMAACVNCHRASRATLVCNACHELGQ
jgi:hypothetical protein